MDLVDQIYMKWEASPYTIPQHVLARVQDQYLIVVNDNSSIYRFMDTNGHIYATPDYYCNVDEDGYYTCSQLHAIMCHPSTQEDHFVEEEILPLFIY